MRAGGCDMVIVVVLGGGGGGGFDGEGGHVPWPVQGGEQPSS